ncbi:MAG: glycosyltransferase family 2 protein [Planctomycetota bacterium]
MNQTLTIAIVTPTRNQVHTLRDTLESILGQDGAGTHFQLQYIVVDGGSTDGSQELIESYRNQLHLFHSGADAGPYDAVNKGFESATADILGWLNGDDLLCPWALRTVASVFEDLPDCQWVTSRRPAAMTQGGQIANVLGRAGFSSAAIRAGAHHPHSLEGLPYIQQESTFFRRGLWESIGGQFDPDYGLAGDADLWMRMASVAELDSVPVPLGVFRYVDGQRSQDLRGYDDEVARSIRQRTGKRLSNARPPASGKLTRLRGKVNRMLHRPSWAYPGSILRLKGWREDHAKWTRESFHLTNLNKDHFSH